jgi:hypothetical protein
LEYRAGEDKFHAAIARSQCVETHSGNARWRFHQRQAATPPMV